MPLGWRTHQQHVAGEPRQTDRRLRHVLGGDGLEVRHFTLVDVLRGREGFADRIIHFIGRNLDEAFHDDRGAVRLIGDVVLLVFDEAREADLHLLEHEGVEPVRKNGSLALEHGMSFHECMQNVLPRDYCILGISQG